MTISGTYAQSFSFSLSIAAVRVGTASAQPATSPADSVTLSPEAASQPATSGETAAPPVPAAATLSTAAQKAETLLQALDADGDGSLTKEEFTDGALALLGRPGRGHRKDADGESGHSVERHHNRSHRFERRLEKVFDRVDADDDGSLDAGELKNALAKTGRKDGNDSSEPAPAAHASYASVTVVAIAVKQYTAVSAT